MDETLTTSTIEQFGNFQWNLEKNSHLIRTRGISYYDIIDAISHGGLLSTELHSPENYPNQKSLIVKHDGYVYCIPFITTPSGNIFLKTIYPSRKYKKKFLI